MIAGVNPQPLGDVMRDRFLGSMVLCAVFAIAWAVVSVIRLVASLL